MGTCWPVEEPATNRERVIKELVQGHESATQLQILLCKPDCGCLSSADELVRMILRSFTETLSMVTSSGESRGVEVCQNLASSQEQGSACCDDRRSEDSGKSKKRPGTPKDKRGCYKRKKISQSWTTVCSTTEDGHAWRKYGQKEILNAKYPRSYYRCSRKHEQGCKATKQVQRKEENPDLFHTTYVGHHTCRDIVKAPHMMITDDSDPNFSINFFNGMISTSDSKIRYDDDGHLYHPSYIGFGSSSSAATTTTLPIIVKQESKEFDQTPPSADHLTNNDVSSLDSIMWKGLMPPYHEEDPHPAMRSDHEPVLLLDSTHAHSCAKITPQSLDMDFVDSIDFDCEFPFDDYTHP